MKLLKHFIPACSFVLLLCLVAAPAGAVDEGLKITEMAVTTKIVKGNPIDSVHRISSASVTALYCFTRLQSAAAEETTIRHVWYRDDEKVGEYSLPVKGKRWRTFSKKTIAKGEAGDWRVEALDKEGRLIGSVKFRMN
jgi:hypothetical protein